MMNRIPIEEWHSRVESWAGWKGPSLLRYDVARSGYDFRESPPGDQCLLVQRNPILYGLSAISASLAIAIGIWLAMGGRVSLSDLMPGFLAWMFMTCVLFAWAFFGRYVVFDRCSLSRGQLRRAGRDGQPAREAFVLRCSLGAGLVAVVLRDGVRDRVLRMYEVGNPLSNSECQQFLDAISRHAPIHPAVVFLCTDALWLPFPLKWMATLSRFERREASNASETQE